MIIYYTLLYFIFTLFYYILLYYIWLYFIVLYYILLYYIIFCYIISYFIILHCILLYYILLCIYLCIPAHTVYTCNWLIGKITISFVGGVECAICIYIYIYLYTHTYIYTYRMVMYCCPAPTWEPYVPNIQVAFKPNRHLCEVIVLTEDLVKYQAPPSAECTQDDEGYIWEFLRFAGEIVMTFPYVASTHR